MSAPRVATPRVAPQRFVAPGGGGGAVARQVTPRNFVAPGGGRNLNPGGGQSQLAGRNLNPGGPAQSAGRNLAPGGQPFRLAGAGPGGAGARVLSNPALAGLRPGGGGLARTAFAGTLAGKPWFHRHHHHRFFPIFVIGWVGPLFWPYAYDDFVGYTFYPYAYDTFWPYAYDDVYVGMFGPYARGVGRSYAAAGKPQQQGGSTVQTDICTGETAGLTDWPIDRIAETVSPDEPQRVALNELKDATAKALDVLRAACPSDLPSTPTGRIEAMHKRLDAMLAAVRTVRPALDKFYQLLTDEQKARFNALGPDDGQQQKQSQRDLAQLCSARASGVGTLPIDRIERAVRPTEPQRVALKELQDAMAEATNQLQTNCPTYRALTPIGRIEAMEQRLDAMLKAVTTVEPVLFKFYGTLTDEQKERFNRLSPAQS